MSDLSNIGLHPKSPMKNSYWETALDEAPLALHTTKGVIKAGLLHGGPRQERMTATAAVSDAASAPVATAEPPPPQLGAR